MMVEGTHHRTRRPWCDHVGALTHSTRHRTRHRTRTQATGCRACRTRRCRSWRSDSS
jgi:hypothetical protein